MNEAENDNVEREFYEKLTRAFTTLFERAKEVNELHFAMALMAEFRGSQGPGWSTAEEAQRTYDDLLRVAESLEKTDPARVRIFLLLYLHVSEGSGFFEIPKSMLLTIDGEGNNITPFDEIVERHRKTGEVMAPNANKIMKDLIGHCSNLGLTDLAECLRDAFDPELRNAIAHADYIVWDDGIRIRKRNGGDSRIIPWHDVQRLLSRGFNVFETLGQIATRYVQSYAEPKTIRARLNQHEPVMEWTIYYDRERNHFGFESGTGS